MPITSKSPNSSDQETADDFREVEPKADTRGLPSQRLRVIHRTVYIYGEPANRSQNQLRLCPRESPWQETRFFLLTIRPVARLQQFRDLNRNTVHHFEIVENHRELSIESHLAVEVRAKIDKNAFPYGCSHAELAECRQMERCHEFLQSSHYVSLEPEIWRAAIDARNGSDDVFQTAYNVMRHVYDNYRYDPSATQVSTSAGEAFRHQHGVCQDFAHVAISMCRSLGIPARYVSGYLFDSTRDHLRGTQASHAWLEVYIKGQGGWFGLDPTNSKVVDENYVTVAIGRDYADVPPVDGAFFGGGAHRKLEVTVDVQRDR